MNYSTHSETLEILIKFQKKKRTDLIHHLIPAVGFRSLSQRNLEILNKLTEPQKRSLKSIKKQGKKKETTDQVIGSRRIPKKEVTSFVIWYRRWDSDLSRSQTHHPEEKKTRSETNHRKLLSHTCSSLFLFVFLQSLFSLPSLSLCFLYLVLKSHHRLRRRRNRGREGRTLSFWRSIWRLRVRSSQVPDLLECDAKPPTRMRLRPCPWFLPVAATGEAGAPVGGCRRSPVPLAAIRY